MKAGQNISGSRRPPAARFDFHSHTFLTDGECSATDMWAAGRDLGHRLLAITDHVGLNDPAPLLDRLKQEARAWEGSDLVTLVGVEVTHVPPPKIADAVRAARRAGAEIVIVHGETIAERVATGTNRAALALPEVDILAHPGLISLEEVELAKSHRIILELSARRGHSLTNGLVLRRALAAGAELVVDSDAHDTADLIPAERARQIALGAGLDENKVKEVLEGTPRKLARRCGKVV